MSRFSWCGWEVEVSKEDTSAWYGQAGEWDCPCGHCRNFLALARGRELPDELLEILDMLSIPPEKATFVCELYHEAAGIFYQVGFRVAGRIISRPERPQPARGGFQGCGEERCAPFEAPGFPEPAFEVELCLALPWVLNEPVEGPPKEP